MGDPILLWPSPIAKEEGTIFFAHIRRQMLKQLATKDDNIEGMSLQERFFMDETFEVTLRTQYGVHQIDLLERRRIK